MEIPYEVMVAITPPAGHEHSLGAILPVTDSPVIVDIEFLAFLVGEHFPVLHKASRKSDVYVRRPEVGLGLVGIEMLHRRISEGHKDRIRPRDKVLRCCSGYSANAVDKNAEIAAVA